jgi:hypothetical protein
MSGPELRLRSLREGACVPFLSGLFSTHTGTTHLSHSNRGSVKLNHISLTKLSWASDHYLGSNHSRMTGGWLLADRAPCGQQLAPECSMLGIIVHQRREIRWAETRSREQAMAVEQFAFSAVGRLALAHGDSQPRLYTAQYTPCGEATLSVRSCSCCTVTEGETRHP